MSTFKDELNQVTKTPIQANNEQWEKRKHQIYCTAENDYKTIKSAILSKAQNGQYIALEDKKYITYEYKSKFLDNCILRHENLRFAFLSGRPITDSVNYTIKNQKEYDYYVDSLTSLAKKDDISISPVFISELYKYKKEVTLPHTFYKDCVIGHKLHSYFKCSIMY